MSICFSCAVSIKNNVFSSYFGDHFIRSCVYELRVMTMDIFVCGVVKVLCQFIIVNDI